ncbi:MAG TPA: hypothetical protein VI248_25105 [Kineosporiaceae bacterium]
MGPLKMSIPGELHFSEVLMSFKFLVHSSVRTRRKVGLVAGGVAAVALAVASFGPLPRSFADGGGAAPLPAHRGEVVHTYRNVYCYANPVDRANPERQLLVNVVRTQSGSNTWLETDASYDQWIQSSRHYQNNGVVFRHTAGPGTFSDDLQPNDLCTLLNNEPDQQSWPFGTWA